MMPFLSREFHLHPRDFGGDETLTYAEINSYLEAARKYADDMKEQDRKMKRSRRR